MRGDKKDKKDRLPDERELEALLGKKPFKGGEMFKDKGSTGGSADRGLMGGLNIPGDKLGGLGERVMAGDRAMGAEKNTGMGMGGERNMER